MKRVFAFNYVLKGPDGKVLDASEKNQPLPFLEGAGQIIPALEEQIKGMKEGEKKIVKLDAKDAYGGKRSEDVDGRSESGVGSSEIGHRFFPAIATARRR